MGGTPLTKQVAALALKKLGAIEVKGKAAHPAYVIYYNGKLEATTTLRHSSTRDIPCDHIKDDLRVETQFVLELARCTKYLIDWAKERGLASAEQAEADRIKRDQERREKIDRRYEMLGFAEYSGDYSKVISMSDEEFEKVFAEAQKAKIARQQN